MKPALPLFPIPKVNTQINSSIALSYSFPLMDQVLLFVSKTDSDGGPTVTFGISLN